MNKVARPQDQSPAFLGHSLQRAGLCASHLCQHLPCRTCGAHATSGRVLCLADGEGRNGVWLAAQGFDVTSVDIAPQGTAKARQLAAARGVPPVAQTHDVTTLPLGEAQWDA